jgi:hypothetical protein
MHVFTTPQKKNEGCLHAGLMSVTSQHDRAAEVFAQIKGGVVDYGEEHSKK